MPCLTDIQLDYNRIDLDSVDDEFVLLILAILSFNNFSLTRSLAFTSAGAAASCQEKDGARTLAGGDLCAHGVRGEQGEGGC